MQRRKKIGLVVLVLGAGIGLALQFRKSEIAPSGATDTTARTQPMAKPESFAGSTIPAAGGQAEPASSPSEPLHSRSPAFEPVSTVPRPMPTAPVQTAADGHLVDLNAPEQTHTIVDGDTLVKLATRYLGSADRSMELFQHNRDVLRNPEELPIGAEIRIPSIVYLSELPQVAPLSSAQSEPTLVPAASQAPGGSATTKRALPTAATKQPGSRTYTVQEGDSLVDIARKFYGDGRRYESLFEANRQVLRTPTNLKPGTVLVVP